MVKRIIENRKKDFGVQEFVCERCTSVFESDEFSVIRSQIRGKANIWKGTVKIAPAYALTTECPACGYKHTSKHVPTGEPSYEVGWDL